MIGTYSRPDPVGAIQPNTFGQLAASNLYVYAWNRPTFFTDPLGLKVVIENPDTQEANATDHVAALRLLGLVFAWR